MISVKPHAKDSVVGADPVETCRRRKNIVIGSLALLAAGCAPPMPDWARTPVSVPAPGTTIVVVSDTQRTSWPEWFFFNREQNEKARRELVNRISRDENPAFVVHLGDLVTAGGDREEWKYFDHLISPLTARNIRILPTLGNHDYWGDDVVAIEEATRRFPELGPCTFHSMHYGNLALVWLNTNLEGEAAKDQARWFESQLQAFEQDCATRGVLVFTHHPPFTNGKHRHGDAADVLSQLLPLFERYKKAVVFMSGHVHGYERFEINGKTYVVTGGGGGPRVEYDVGRDACPMPAYQTASGEPRAFNYVVIEPGDTKLTFTVKCIDAASDATPTTARSAGQKPAWPRGPAPRPAPRKPFCKNGVLEQFTVPLPEATPCGPTRVPAVCGQAR